MIDPNQILAQLRNDDCNYADALSAITAEKHDAQSSGDEVYANQLWVAESVIDVHKQFVQVYELLKSENYYKAWCKAEQIEITIQFISSNSQEGYENVKDINEIIRQLQSLFPYRFFASYVMHIQKEKCSICGQERSIRHFCEHRKGKIYNGELCCNIVTQAELKGIDIVENPVHKYAVLFPSDETGQHDHYDYSLVSGLMRFWQKPFQCWRYEVRTIYKQKKEFSGLTNESYCPCCSGKTYGECCSNNSEGIKHKVYTFIVEPIQE